MLRLLSVVILLACGACASITVSSDFDLQADFSSYGTWDWHAQPPMPAGDVRIDNDLFHQNLRTILGEELAARGLTRAVGKADLLVTWHASIARTSIATVDDYYGYHSFGPTRSTVQVSHIESGTLVVDLVDAKSNRLVWRGTATGVVQTQASAEKRRARMQEAVHELLAGYPPLARATSP